LGTSKPVYTVFDQLMDEMDPVLLDLVKTTVNSFAIWDVFLFGKSLCHQYARGGDETA
jgi:hypothetical protein